MSRLSRAMKREQKRAASAERPVPPAPIDVRVPAAGPGAGISASIGGVPVTAAPGEEIQRAVLTHLQRIAVAAGHPVYATVHDERIGYVVPLCVEQDGSSRYTAEPLRTEPPRPPVAPAPPAPPEEDRATQVLRPARAPEEEAPPTRRLRTLSGRTRTGEAAPGTVAPPLGQFGPPPSMEAPARSAPWPDAMAPEPQPLPTAPTAPERQSPASVPSTASAPSTDPVPSTDPLPVSDPDPQPAPPRGFDAVAETVLGDGPRPGATADTSPFAEPMARVYDAVGEGRTGEADELVRRTMAEASALLGPDHTDVLRMRELAAYIAYLAGEPERAFGLSLDVARAYHRAGDAEAAYSGLQGAATAWRAVRDPALGQDLGRGLLGLWSDLVAEGGPAAEEAEELESARARMDRLAARAARAARAEGTTGAQDTP
ncbi:tetratricopeptide repeat protein [Streptomyces sp. KAU_LT]|uniref:tetratricopeptide repeat protein n=1 Tax=Streptomyces sp. KAU_LT TaxID=3046669 RepID=UPI0024B84CDA|nr:tetratricopeptide repeat protein [Streptomyces sp. KAU_LT]MDI9831858.1 tetratricopeptide repeat protein [Streptomyces sp. KAU_LT]